MRYAFSVTKGFKRRDALFALYKILFLSPQVGLGIIQQLQTIL